MNIKATLCFAINAIMGSGVAFAISNTEIISESVVVESMPSAHIESNGVAYADDFRLLAYNVYMLPKIVARWNNEGRALMILQSEVVKGHDAVLLQELFDNGSATTLLNGFKVEYPYQTPVLGRTRDGWDATLGSYSNVSPEDGGVAIVSRWPIEERIQYVYKQGCGADYFANKGFVYARINKKGLNYHVIATHAQAEDNSCLDPAAIRKTQFTEIQDFISSHNIPTDEVVFMGGDFNVIKDSAEYPDMIQTLQVSTIETFAGFSSSWDPESNGIAAYNSPSLTSEYLDYIFVSRNHAQPSHWHNQSLDVISTNWEIGNNRFQELSDHYPISAFSYANDATLTESFRAVNNPYQGVQFQNKGNGKFVRIDVNDNRGWLTIKGELSDSATVMNLDNWYPNNRAFCIRHDDWIQVQGAQRTGSYWNWWLGAGGGNYAFFTNPDNASNKLRLRILNDDGDCLKDGDQITFVDRNTLDGKDYYLQRWSSGSWQDYLYLNSSTIGDNETFIIHMGQAVKQDFSANLRY
jgi:sphingomyelin phosphodiesterase